MLLCKNEPNAKKVPDTKSEDLNAKMIGEFTSLI